MRILTVRNPWAWAIIHGRKNIENRARNIAGTYRGPVAVHVGLEYDDAWSSQPMLDAMQRLSAGDERPWREHFGQIIGVVDLVGVHTADDIKQTRDLLGLWPTCSPWAERRGVHLELANPRPLPSPVTYRGALSLRLLDPLTTAHIEELLA